MRILDLFLASWEPKPRLASKILGCFFLMLSGAGGAYFLFHALALQLGYLESGGLTCGTLAILGACFLFIEKKKEPTLPEVASQKISNVIKDFDIEKILKENAVPLSLLSLGVGIILSQIKNPKNLSEIYKIIK